MKDSKTFKIQFKYKEAYYYQIDNLYFKKGRFKERELINKQTFSRILKNYANYRNYVKKFNRKQIRVIRKKDLSKTNVYRVLDLFCGCGGLSLGFEKAGFEVILAIDNDISACETYSLNFKDACTLCLDLTEKNGNPLELMKKLKKKDLKFDIIIGGPPCQGFSVAARSKILSLIKEKKWDDNNLINEDYKLDNTHWFYNDPRNILYKKFLNYVNFFSPILFIIENVPGMHSYRNGEIIDQIKLDFEEIGYSIQEKVLNSFHFNVPQKRKRIFFVGVNCKSKKYAKNRNKIIFKNQFKEFDLNNNDYLQNSNFIPLFKYPDKNSKYIPFKNKFFTVKDAIGDLNGISEFGEEIKYNSFIKEKNYLSIIRSNEKNNKLYNFVPRDTTSRDNMIYKFMKQGDKYKDLPERIRQKMYDKSKKLESECEIEESIKEIISECMPYGDGNKFGDKFKRLIWNQPTWTILAHLHKDGYMFIHPEKNRTISVREAARLQSFPDDFIFQSSRTNQFKHVGNAVPPIMSQILALHIKDYIELLNEIENNNRRSNANTKCIRNNYDKMIKF